MKKMLIVIAVAIALTGCTNRFQMLTIIEGNGLYSAVFVEGKDTFELDFMTRQDFYDEFGTPPERMPVIVNNRPHN